MIDAKTSVYFPTAREFLDNIIVKEQRVWLALINNIITLDGNLSIKMLER